MEISLSHSSGSKYLHQYLREEATTKTTTKQTQNHNLKQKQKPEKQPPEKLFTQNIYNNQNKKYSEKIEQAKLSKNQVIAVQLTCLEDVYCVIFNANFVAGLNL